MPAAAKNAAGMPRRSYPESCRYDLASILNSSTLNWIGTGHRRRL